MRAGLHSYQNVRGTRYELIEKIALRVIAFAFGVYSLGRLGLYATISVFEWIIGGLVVAFSHLDFGAVGILSFAGPQPVPIELDIANDFYDLEDEEAQYEATSRVVGCSAL